MSMHHKITTRKAKTMNLQDMIIKNMKLIAILLVTLFLAIVLQSVPVIQNVIVFGIIGGIVTYGATKVLLTVVDDK